MKMESLPPNKTKLSFFRLTRCTPVEEAAANEKKREFLPPNKTNAIKSLFFRTVGRDDVDQWIKDGIIPRLIGQMHLMLSFFGNNGRGDVDQ